MARVTVELPTILDTLPEIVEASARAALAVATTEGAAAAKAACPVNLGTLRRGIAAAPVRATPRGLAGGVAVTGVAAEYAGAIESGRRPGARGPTTRHFAFAPGFRGADWSDEAAQRGGWVNRKMRQQVEALADKLMAEQVASRTTKRKARRLKRSRYIQKARYLIASGVAEAVHSNGIQARRFASAQVPTITARFGEVFTAQMARRTR